MAFEVFVRNIPWTMGRRELAKLAAHYGKVLNVRLEHDKSTGMHKGWGFVNFATRDGAESLLQQKDLFAEGNQIYVGETSTQRRSN